VKTVDFDLMSGPGSNMVVARRIASGVQILEVNSITYQVPSDLSPEEQYSIRATSGDSFVQYTGNFKISGGVAAADKNVSKDSEDIGSQSAGDGKNKQHHPASAANSLYLESGFAVISGFIIYHFI
jgi:hypothetical protein